MFTVKKFDFPSFDEWVKNKSEVKVKIGFYIAEIGITSWGYNGNTTNTYSAAFSCFRNPFNLYSDCIFKRTFAFDYRNDDKDALRKWYEESCEKLNENYLNHIESTYLVKDIPNIFVAIARGDCPEEYLAIGLSEDEARSNCIKEYFGEDGHIEEDLNECGYELTVSKLNSTHSAEGV